MTSFEGVSSTLHTTFVPLGGERTYTIGLGKDRSLGESQYSSANPK